MDGLRDGLRDGLGGGLRDEVRDGRAATASCYGNYSATCETDTTDTAHVHTYWTWGPCIRIDV